MLHIISRIPLSPAILERMADGDAAVFIENAVFSLLQQSQMHELLIELMKKVQCYALAPDLEVRGIEADTILSGIRVIEYTDFVQLTVEYSVIQSW